MYIEISPRQSGKTTRLIDAAENFILNNGNNTKIAIVSYNLSNSNLIREKILNKLCSTIPIDECERIKERYSSRIKVLSNTCVSRGEHPPDYWFFDEFAYISRSNLFPGPAVHNDYTPGNRIPSGVGNMIITNAYYSTTPAEGNNEVLDILVNWCQENQQEIVFNNPWTEQRIAEQYGFDTYIREHVVNSWTNYMIEHGFMVTDLKENWLTKHIKKNNFISGSKGF